MKQYIPGAVVALVHLPAYEYTPELLPYIFGLTCFALILGYLHTLPSLIRAVKFSRDRAQNNRIDLLDEKIKKTREWLAEVEEVAVPLDRRNRK